MEFDHDAILLDEPGAATPEQGVGMMVNKAVTADGDKIDVINSAFEELAEREMEYAIAGIMRAVEMQEKASVIERIKTAVKEALGLGRETETEANEVQEMTEVTKEQFDELSAQVNKLAEVDIKAAIAEAVAPLVEAQNAAKETAEAEAKAAHAKAVEAVVNKGILEQAVAEKLDVEALNALAATVGAPAEGAGKGFTNKADDFGFGAY
jgi:hypothetical protein